MWPRELTRGQPFDRSSWLVENMKRTQTGQEAPTAKSGLLNVPEMATRVRLYTIITWLGCETEILKGKRVVTRLNCSVCSTCKYKDRTLGRRNYSDHWIVGDTSNIRDRSTTPKLQSDVTRCREQAARGPGGDPGKVYSSAPRKFDIAYVLAQEKLLLRVRIEARC